jgi:uncharacterized protein involved in exopolysaccharide biosynthesis
MITRNSTSASLETGRRSPEGARDVLRILYRHRRKMVAVFFSILAIAVVGLIVFPRTYTSEARMFVRLGKESIGLDATATMNEVVSVNESREGEINSELEILRSRILLEDVVERVGSDEILNKSNNGESRWIDTLLVPVSAASAWLTPNVSPHEKAVLELGKMISVYSPRKSNVLIATCKARDPKLAQGILQAFLDSYLVRHGTVNRTAGSYEFFVDQADLLREQLTLATEKLRDAKNKNGLASVEGQRTNVQAQANSIEVAMLENERALSSADAKIEALKKTLTELPEKSLAEESDVPSHSADLMRHELYKVQIAEKDASSRYTALHPQVIALRRQVEETRKILSSEEAHSRNSTHRLSPVHQAVQTELASLQATSAAHKAEAKSLKHQFEAVQSKIRALNDNELQITDLTRKSELIEDNYRSYVKNREQARVDQAMELGRISNVNVPQPATFAAKPSSPMVKLTLALAFVLASIGAVLVAFVAEHFDRSLRSAEQVEQELGLPVLFSVPRNVRHELVQN